MAFFVFPGRKIVFATLRKSVGFLLTIPSFSGPVSSLIPSFHIHPKRSSDVSWRKKVFLIACFLSTSPPPMFCPPFLLLAPVLEQHWSENIRFYPHREISQEGKSFSKRVWLQKPAPLWPWLLLLEIPLLFLPGSLISKRPPMMMSLCEEWWWWWLWQWW